MNFSAQRAGLWAVAACIAAALVVSSLLWPSSAQAASGLGCLDRFDAKGDHFWRSVGEHAVEGSKDGYSFTCEYEEQGTGFISAYTVEAVAYWSEGKPQACPTSPDTTGLTGGTIYSRDRTANVTYSQGEDGRTGPGMVDAARQLLQAAEGRAVRCGEEQDADAGSERPAAKGEPSTQSGGGADHSEEAMAIAAGLILALVSGTSLVRMRGGGRVQPIVDADGNELVVQDGTRGGGGRKGDVWYGGRWVDPEHATRLIADDRTADKLHAQQAQQFQHESRAASDRWTQDWTERNQREADLDSERRQREWDASQADIRRAQDFYRRYLEREVDYNQFLSESHGEDAGAWHDAMGRAEAMQWLSERGIDALADKAPFGKVVKAGYNITKGTAKGLFEGMYQPTWSGAREVFAKNVSEGMADVLLDGAQELAGGAGVASGYQHFVKVTAGVPAARRYQQLVDGSRIVKVFDALATGAHGYALDDLTWKNFLKELAGFEREGLLESYIPSKKDPS